MSLKRVADRQLTQDNWDDDDRQPDDSADGKFAPADPDVIASRKIRTALRRKQNAPDQEKKGIFTGFSGFKTSASATTPSFNFISNLVPDKNNSSKNNLLSITKSATFNTLSTEKNINENKKEPISLLTTPNSKTPTPPETPTLKKNDEYYVNLKNLNISVSEWIKSHVDKNPYCILTPIFDDYINHLKELEKLKQNVSSPVENKETSKKTLSSIPTFHSENNITNNKITNDKDSSKNDHSITTNKQTPFGSTPFLLSAKVDGKPEEKKSDTSKQFSFGQGFSSTPVSKAPMFSFGSKAETATSPPFSFGAGKPFTFGNLANKDTAPPPHAATEEENEEDEPPKVSFTPVVEEDSIYSKRCKVFVKKDDIFGDRGVGTLYLKPIKDSEKHQLIVRADTSLGNLLLNIVLSDIPLQRMGKNNVMLMCIPTSDSPPSPVPTLLRVKTADEADQLLETLNKYKK